MKTAPAAEIGRVRDRVANRVTGTFLARHPDWFERYGARATTHGVQDARHHIDFVQAAVELDDPATFCDYALWCRDLLISRGISVRFLIEILETIRDEMADVLSPAAAEAMQLAMAGGLEAITAGEPSPKGGDAPLTPACRLYLAASVSGRRDAALGIVQEAVRGGEAPVDVYVEIFQDALYEVGRRWQTTGLTIAEEHMATATTQFILSVLHEDQPRAESHGGTAVVTGVVNEHHAVGASIVANVLDAEGWDVRYIGTNLPLDTIVSAIVQTRATLVAISVTMSAGVASARDLIIQVRAKNADPPRIIVGGAAFLRDPQLWQSIGADGFAPDARSVAALARG